MENNETDGVSIMCNHGISIEIPVWHREGWEKLPDDIIWTEMYTPQPIDVCLAVDIYKMTNLGIRTLTSCCMHGEPLTEDSGQIMIDSRSVYTAIKHGYDVRVFHRIWNRGDGAEDEQPTYEVRV